MRASTAAFSLSGVWAAAAAASTSEIASAKTANRRRPMSLVSPIGGPTLPGFSPERLQRRGNVASQWADLRPVVLVGDRPGPVLELELLERRERAVARLEQVEPPALVLVELVEDVRLRFGLPDERERDGDHTHDGERRSEHECQGQGVAGRPASDARATSLRCSRRSGHSVTSEPTRKTSPASQMRFTRGLTNTRNWTLPSRFICSAITKRSSPVTRSLRMPTSFEI